MQIEALTSALRGAVNADGGWAYYAGKTSRIEPTAWALLALAPTGEQADRHVAFLTGLEGRGLLLADRGSASVNYGWNGLALIALGAAGTDRALALRRSMLEGVAAAKGVQLGNDGPRVVAQDGMLQAWSWTEGTFSWVEPTAYCLLALKQTPGRTPAIQARIDEAERVLADRVCGGGGWNYGNSAVLDQDLRPYVPTTALALLAMQDRPDNEAVRQSLAWLEAHATSESSAMALSLAAIALSAFGRPVRGVLTALGRQYEATGFLGNAHLTAMALYALALPSHRARAFRVDAT